MKNLPSGTVTFLFADIEGSTRLWQEQPEAIAIAHSRHDEILRTAIEFNHGYVFQIVGDSFSGAFHNAIDGLCAGLAAQRALQQTSEFLKNSEVLIRARMGLHTGTAEILPDGKYEGNATLASTQREMSAAHGGQTLLTQTTYDLLQDAIPSDVTLHDMGEHRLKDLRAPLRLYQVNVPDLPQNFPIIKSLDTQPNNIPAQLTSFIGRENEIAEIKASLNSSRLVTLTGSGGTGNGLLVSQIGNVIMSSVPSERGSEAGGLQGTAMNLGASLGVALIGSILIASLVTNFQTNVLTDPALADIAPQLAAKAEASANFATVEQVASAAEQAGLSPAQVDAITVQYVDAQIAALKAAFAGISLFSQLGLAYVRRLPSKEDEIDGQADDDKEPVPQAA